jgi:hypothetical protein
MNLPEMWWPFWVDQDHFHRALKYMWDQGKIGTLPGHGCFVHADVMRHYESQVVILN